MPSELSLTVAEQLSAIEEIKRTFAARLHCLDTKQWEVYPRLHADDVVSETWSGLPDDKQPRTENTSNRVVGKEKLTRAISAVLGGPTAVTTVHHGHTPEIELTSDTTARGIWAMEDKLWWKNGDHEEHLHGYGHYHEEYRKTNGRWLISYRKLTRLRVDQTERFFDYLAPL
ncbi:nuclear transport factor 2 family protein [Sciscionella marina]|uniref:nuclear transport factor 2 family protein n=1 Tax=Sciscionella marina TaxID=508770 RepID=UPI000376396F|nr:nuclear transport factor 2 family protein [Sciscionella marina]